MKNHKKIFLKINVEQPVKIEGGFIEFKNYFKQVPVPFKSYADFECILKSVKSNEDFYTAKNIKSTFFAVFLASLFVLIINLVNQLLFIEVKIPLTYLLKQFLKSKNTVKK